MAPRAEPRAERRPDGDLVSDFERTAGSPDGSRRERPAAAGPRQGRRERLDRPRAARRLVAVAGGIAWGLVSKWTDYEVGIVAWGIGFLSASRSRAAGGRRSADLQASRS